MKQTIYTISVNGTLYDGICISNPIVSERLVELEIKLKKYMTFYYDANIKIWERISPRHFRTIDSKSGVWYDIICKRINIIDDIEK